jgi:hypothetical protein
MINYYNEDILKLAANVSDLTKKQLFYMKQYQLFLHYSLKIDCPKYNNTHYVEVVIITFKSNKFYMILCIIYKFI